MEAKGSGVQDTLHYRVSSGLTWTTWALASNTVKKDLPTLFLLWIIWGIFSLILIQITEVSIGPNTVSSKSTLVTGIRYCYGMSEYSMSRCLRNLLEVNDTESWDKAPSVPSKSPFSWAADAWLLGIKNVYPFSLSRSQRSMSSAFPHIHYCIWSLSN